jgi:hypothetical protein
MPKKKKAQSNPERFSAKPGEIVMLGRITRTVNHLTPEEIADNERELRDAMIREAREAAMKEE